MSIAFTAAVFLVTLIVAGWLLTSRSRRQSSTAQIIDRLSPGALHALDQFISSPTFMRDAEFWRLSGGMRGVMIRRTNATVLLQLCQKLVVAGQFPAEDVRQVAARCLAINLLIALSLPEAVIRFAVPAYPHIFARMVTNLYAEVQTRVRTLCEEYTPDVLSRLDDAIV